MEDVPGGNRDRGGGSSPAPLGEAAGSALFIQLLFRNSVVATDALWPPNGGWAARLGLWEGQLAAESPSLVWEGRGSEGSLEGLCWTNHGRCRSRPLNPCSVHNKGLFFPSTLQLVPAAFHPFGMAWREGKLRARVFFPQPCFRWLWVRGERGAAGAVPAPGRLPSASLQPGEGLWGANPRWSLPWTPQKCFVPQPEPSTSLGGL